MRFNAKNKICKYLINIEIGSQSQQVTPVASKTTMYLYFILTLITAAVDTATQFPVLQFIILRETDVERGFYHRTVLYYNYK